MLLACENRMPSGAQAPAIKTTSGLVKFSLGDGFSGLLFERSSDFTKNGNRLGLLILLKHLEDIGHGQTQYRLRTNVQGGADTHAGHFESPGYRTRLPAAAGDNPDRTRFEKLLAQSTLPPSQPIAALPGAMIPRLPGPSILAPFFFA